MELCSPPYCRLFCVGVYLCMDRATHPLCVMGDFKVTPMNNASNLVPPLASLFSGRSVARRVPGPSQPSFPHGKYLTLPVAHLPYNPHIYKKKKTLYV